jgi:hypothetical protein
MAEGDTENATNGATQLWMLRLQAIQTVVIVLGVAFALFELRNLSDERRQARFEATAVMLGRFGEQAMIDGASALLAASRLEQTDENYNAVLAQLTPLRQHYITWSACLAEDICLHGASRDLFCQRLIAYEFAVEDVMQRFNRPYDQVSRGHQYFGQLERCRDEHSDWIEATFR